MPSSRPIAVPFVVDLVRQVRPESILDVGVGFGKYGHLFREYTDVIAAEGTPERYARDGWKTRIEGIEAHREYLTPMHDFLYDKITIGDARDVMRELSTDEFDLIWLGDVIEHLSLDDGRQLLEQCLRVANKAVAVCTPSRFTPQSAVCGNAHERHLSFWARRDFSSVGRCVVRELPDEVRLAVFATNDQPLPSISHRHLNLGEKLWRWRQRLLGPGAPPA